MSGRWRKARCARRILRTVHRVRESSEDVQVHAPAAWREKSRADDGPDLSRVRRPDGDSPWTLRRVPRLRPVPEMSRNAVDAVWGEVSKGWRRHCRAQIEEAREGFLWLRELSGVRF